MEPTTTPEVSNVVSGIASSLADEAPKPDHCGPISLPDYSPLFGEEFQIPDGFWDPMYLNVLDSAAVEEGIMHVLYASASQVFYMQANLIAPMQWFVIITYSP